MIDPKVPPDPPTFADVLEAEDRLRGVAVETPILRSDALDVAVGGRVLIKVECLQRTGSFKFRGAYNRLSRLTEAERFTGVVAYSSGNHAQAVAAAAAIVGVEAILVLPSDAPLTKIAGARAHGAEVVLYDRQTQSREAIAEQIALERGAVLIPAFEDPAVIAGQGTAGLEAVRQAQAVGATIDVLLCPASGGGLIAGVGLAFSELSPKTRLYAVEPVGFEDLALSLAEGVPTPHVTASPSVQDALMAAQPGRLAFALNQRQLTGAYAVSDEEAMVAMAFAFERLRIVLEPSGAAGLAALLSGRVALDGQTALVIASGGNVDPDVFARAICPTA